MEINRRIHTRCLVSAQALCKHKMNSNCTFYGYYGRWAERGRLQRTTPPSFLQMLFLAWDADSRAWDLSTQRYDPKWQDIIILGGVGGDSGKLGCPHHAAPRSWLCREGHPCEEGCASEHAGQEGFMWVSTSVHTQGHASFSTCLSQSMPTPRSRAPRSGDSLRLFSVSQSKVLLGRVPHPRGL